MRSEYGKIFVDHFKKLDELWSQQEATEREIAKVSQMLRAVFNLLPEQERKIFADLVAQLTLRNRGLTEAVRMILEADPTHWFNAVEVRDKLQESGFDFSDYSSNPLSSIHSVLKRLKRTEVKTREALDGTKGYRWIKRSWPSKSLISQKPGSSLIGEK